MLFLVIIFGLIFGSFLNVVICRLQKNESLAFPASHCPVCNAPIKRYDNIPVISYILLRGRCRSCKVKITLRYPLVELLTALILVSLLFRFGITAEWGLYSVLMLFLIPIAFIDWDTRLILNKLTIPGFIMGLIFIPVFQIENWTQPLLGAIIGGLTLFLLSILGKFLFKKESIGFGDVKLLVLIGVYTGFPDVVYCFLFSIFTAAIFILTGLVLKKITLGDMIPFGPFIAIGTLGYLLIGKEIIQWYMNLYFHV